MATREQRQNMDDLLQHHDDRSHSHFTRAVKAQRFGKSKMEKLHWKAFDAHEKAADMVANRVPGWGRASRKANLMTIQTKGEEIF